MEAEHILVDGDVKQWWSCHSWSSCLGHIVINVEGFVDGGTIFEINEVRTLYPDFSSVVYSDLGYLVIDDTNSFIDWGDGMQVNTPMGYLCCPQAKLILGLCDHVYQDWQF